MGTAINIHRQFEKERVDTYGFSSRSELRKVEKEAKREEKQAELNFDIVKKYIKRSVIGVFLTLGIKGVFSEEFFQDGILMMDFYIDGDKKQAIYVERVFNNLIGNSGIDLNDLIKVKFFSKDEKHEELFKSLEKNNTIPIDTK